MDKNIFENEKVAEIFGDSLPNLYTFYYEGNYLPTDEIQNLVKNMLSNNSLTYLYLPNNQIGDDSLEILAFLLSKNYNIHTLDLSYNKFTSNHCLSLFLILKFQNLGKKFFIIFLFSINCIILFLYKTTIFIKI